MLKSIEGNFDNPEVHELLTKHFVELRAASPEGSAHVLDIPGLKDKSIKFWSLWQDEKIDGMWGIKIFRKKIMENLNQLESTTILEEWVMELM
jgi:putative acetyltransferase